MNVQLSTKAPTGFQRPKLKIAIGSYGHTNAVKDGSISIEGVDAEMIEVLKRQKFADGIPAGLPPGIAVAHKTGSITRNHHDAGIVYATRPYVLVILVRGIQEEKESAALMAKLSKTVFESSSR